MDARFARSMEPKGFDGIVGYQLQALWHSSLLLVLCMRIFSTKTSYQGVYDKDKGYCKSSVRGAVSIPGYSNYCNLTLDVFFNLMHSR